MPVPYSEEVVRKEVARILEAAELRDRVHHLDRLVATRYGFERVISRSARMQVVFDRGTAAARSDTPVLIVGETGTGKELIARAIHANGRRARRPFVPINCAALPRDLVESELFGHRRGAFSGAVTDHPGLFVAAHGGSLFLDEMSELPLDAQAKLLRVLQNGEVRPVGGLDSRHVDVRIIAAAIAASPIAATGHAPGSFFRLSVLVIEIPPLRERREDLSLLIAHFLDRRGSAAPAASTASTPQRSTCWPRIPFRQFRELENMIEGLSVMLPAACATIRADDVRGWLQRRGVAATSHGATRRVCRSSSSPSRPGPSREALRQAHGNKSAAAHILGISRDTLYRKLHELGCIPSVRHSDIVRLSDNTQLTDQTGCASGVRESDRTRRAIHIIARRARILSNFSGRIVATPERLLPS